MINDKIYDAFKKFPAFKIYPFGFDIPAVVAETSFVNRIGVPNNFDKYISELEITVIALNAGAPNAIDPLTSYFWMELWSGSVTYVAPVASGGFNLSPSFSTFGQDFGTMFNVPFAHVLTDTAIATTVLVNQPKTIKVNRFLKNSDILSIAHTYMLPNLFTGLVLGKIYCLEGNLDLEKIGGVS